MNVAIIVAGGSGLRMGSEIPKQFLRVAGKPILMHTLGIFRKYDSDMAIILVLPESQISYWERLCESEQFGVSHDIVKGGETRYHSVRNGLMYAKEHYPEAESIAVHDGVRPLVSTKTIGSCFDDAWEYGSAIPVMASVESVRLIDERDSKLSYAIDRRRVMLVQTPQVFSAEMIYSSYDIGYRETFTDDASVCEAAGYKMHLTEGNKENVKITTPDDLILAETLLKKSK
jgi:2-C-methyl-D-erythritol 4-phosphate cytidylyltransferase